MSKKLKQKQQRKKEVVKMKLLNFYIVIALVLSCSNKMGKAKIKEVSNCEVIAQLEKKYSSKEFSFEYINEVIPELEKKTKISSQATKDIDGYHYKNDTLFHQDIKKWKEYFKCK